MPWIDQEKGLAMKKWHEMTYVTPIDIINNCWRTSLSLINPTSSFCQKKNRFPLSLSKGSQQHVERHRNVEHLLPYPGKTVCNMQGATVNKHYMESGWIKRADLHRRCHQVVSRQNSPDFHQLFGWQLLKFTSKDMHTMNKNWGFLDWIPHIFIF